jgi:DNA-binding beta-propeller fold protein YncE
VKLSKDGKFIKWWGGKGTGPGQFDVPHSITMDEKGRIYVGDRSNNRVQIFDKDGKFINQWTDLGTPWGVTVRDDLMYLVDGTANGCLLIVRLKDGKVVDRIEGLVNPTAVAVDSKGAIYVGEVNGTNVKKFVKK